MATWERDHQMLAHSDVLLAFVTPEDLANNSGTVGLVDQAWHDDVTAYAYLVHEDGRVTLYGSTDETDEWRGRVPA